MAKYIISVLLLAAFCSVVLSIQHFTGKQGFFTSPNFPRNYPNNRQEQYNISVSPGSRIKLVFLTFSMQISSGCKNDYLRIREKGGSISKTLCGIYPEDSFISEDNELMIEFNSDSYSNSGGFEIWFYEIAGLPKGKHGSFSSPNYPKNYPHNRREKYKVTVNPGSRIKLTFVAFSLEDSSGCRYDYLQIREKDGSILKKLCGTNPGEFTSKDNELIIEFKSDSSVSSQGFKAKYFELVPSTVPIPTPEVRRVGCFVSPNYPRNYPHNRNEAYKIAVNPGSKIKLTFVTFSLESSPGCIYDYLRIREKDGSVSKTLCGKNPGDFVSKDNELMIEFHSDANKDSQGFYARYTELSPWNNGSLPTPVVRSHYASTEHLRGKSGCFASPNFPNRYPSQSRRRYKITVNPGFRIKLTFTTFSLDWSSSCRYDYLRIMEKDGSISKTLCGKYPGDFISKDNELMVEFQSVTSNHGFDARFFALTASEAAQLTTKRPTRITTPAPIATCGGTFTSLNGSFASPGYPKWDYPNAQKCQYEIRVPTDRRIVLTIEAFDLEARYDFLWVKQVASGKIVDMALLTGTHIDGRRFTSVENVLILLFTSDGSGRDRGFAVSYHTIESACPAKHFTASSGVVTSPHYPKNYFSYANCNYTITVPKGKRIKMKFYVFDVHSCSRCSCDKLSIYDGKSMTLLTRLCYSGPREFTSIGNTLFMRFTSSRTVNKQGFYGTYEAVDISSDATVNDFQFGIQQDAKEKAVTGMHAD